MSVTLCVTHTRARHLSIYLCSHLFPLDTRCQKVAKAFAWRFCDKTHHQPAIYKTKGAELQGKNGKVRRRHVCAMASRFYGVLIEFCLTGRRARCLSARNNAKPN